MSFVARDGDPSDLPTARGQAFFSVIVLLVFIALAEIAQVAMAHDYLLVRRRVSDWKQTDGMYVDERFFNGAEDRLLLNVLPGADYSKGGIYFTGASLTQRSLMPWTWPQERQQQIHNYCVAAATHSEQAQFIRYLVEHEDLLKYGAAKTAIITELFFGSAAQSKSTEFLEIDAAWRSFFLHNGLFTYDTEGGLNPAPSPAFLRSCEIKAVKTNLFWNWAMQFAHLSVQPPYLIPGKRSKPDEARAYWARRLGPDWQRAMDEQLMQYSKLIDFLQSRQVRVAGIFMPLASWFDDYPQADQYREKVLHLLSTKSVQVLDLQHAVDDSGFADTSHLNYAGTVQIQPALLGFAKACLLKMEQNEKTP